ncbi:hypothetical protein [Burkholderia singularis]|uniref:hypothetical protein n=1 Tax=Burkholderia singularis TaxID=1503053 RepID=UPI000AE37106|nr:hypothetical protein [Burkholderia singularis]
MSPKTNPTSHANNTANAANQSNHQNNQNLNAVKNGSNQATQGLKNEMTNNLKRSASAPVTGKPGSFAGGAPSTATFNQISKNKNVSSTALNRQIKSSTEISSQPNPSNPKNAGGFSPNKNSNISSTKVISVTPQQAISTADEELNKYSITAPTPRTAIEQRAQTRANLGDNQPAIRNGASRDIGLYLQTGMQGLKYDPLPVQQADGSASPVTRGQYQNQHIEPIQGNSNQYMLDTKAPPSSNNAYQSAQTLASPNTAIESRRNISIKDGYGDPSKWTDSDYAKYWLDNASTWNPGKILANLISGHGAIDPMSKIGKANKAYDDDFTKEKTKMVDSMMSLFRDSAQQLPTDGLLKNILDGKASDGEKQLPMQMAWVIDPQSGTPVGLDMTVGHNYVPDGATEIFKKHLKDGKLDSSDRNYLVNIQYSGAHYQLSLSNGAIRRISKPGPDPSFFSNPATGAPESQFFLSGTPNGDTKGNSPVYQQVSAGDLKSYVRQSLDANVEQYREPYREMTPKEFWTKMTSDVVKNSVPFTSAIDYATQGKWKEAAVNFFEDALGMVTMGPEEAPIINSLKGIFKIGENTVDDDISIGQKARDTLNYVLSESNPLPSPFTINNTRASVQIMRDLADAYVNKKDPLSYSLVAAAFKNAKFDSAADTALRNLGKFYHYYETYSKDQPSQMPMARGPNGQLQNFQPYGGYYRNLDVTQTKSPLAPGQG